MDGFASPTKKIRFTWFIFDSHGLRAKQSIDSLLLDRVGIFFNIGEVNSITLHAEL